MTATGPLASTAVVDTDRGGRYAKQLASHLSRRLETTWDEDAGTGSVALDGGRCDLTASASGLTLHATTAWDLEPEAMSQQLERIEDVVGRHLVRFGARDELVVEWNRADGSRGRTYRHLDAPEDGHTPPG